METSGNLRGEQQAEFFAKHGPKMQDVLMSARPPIAYALTKNDKLTLLSLKPRRVRAVRHE